MSKQSEAKERQGYNPKPLARSCRNCGNLAIEKIHSFPPYEKYFKKKLTCDIGDFAVKAQAACNEFKAAD